jgi:hypothetical protein
MTQLKFVGMVELGDPCRCCRYDDEGFNGAVMIRGRDVVGEIRDAKFKGKVTVGIADESFNGDLFVETGWGYSEYTPMDPDVLKVGGHDLLEILRRYEGQRVTVWVSDEPINLLEG